MELVFFDTETGGIADDKPTIQLAAVAVDQNWNELESFESKIRFDESKADPEALKINHYDRDIWKEQAKPLCEVVAKFDQFICRHRSISMVSKRTGSTYTVARLAGHNSSFDQSRLKLMYGERFIPCHPQALCTLSLAHWMSLRWERQPENFKLETLLKFFGIEMGSHDALWDVRGSVLLAKKLMNGSNGIGAS